MGVLFLYVCTDSNLVFVMVVEFGMLAILGCVPLFLPRLPKLSGPFE